ncbi:hypothetical protein [uncultured Bacteroides sp.]|uniref:hypothetical protein n=1 Tax=uncultured Bacteroides sp. TaxID=162156 RepID=UPI00260F06AB|nr:hypothetical protein [uncultured Bacteroides sp.]
MKLNRFFMLGLAGLAFAACSNEEEAVNNGTQFKGNGAVSVRIVSPDLMTRNAGGATTGNNNSTVAIEGDLTITLTGKKLDAEGNPTVPYEETIVIDAETLKSQSEENATVLKFWNIAIPEKLTASINGGVADYSKVGIATLQQEAKKIQAYGETINFTLSEDQEGQSPDHNNDNDTKDDGTEQGAAEDGSDDETVYQMYEASVVMAIPVARLEVSNIMHVVHEGEPDDVCIFTELIANGAYMDGYTTIGGVYSEDTHKYGNGGAAGDFSFDGANGTGTQSDLLDVIPSGSFKSGETLAGPFTYNFYTNGTNPQFKIYFGTAKGTNIIEPRYAMITNYKKSTGESVTFENGKIYRILSATLKDKNIIGDEGGNTLYGVEVTVEEATWTVVDIEADWAE